jgi:anaerobic ribonucleoside-triphosphate reductase activating protein
MGAQASQAIRIAGVVRQSIVDGPGMRFVVFTQGCPHHCPGCHNPETHSFSGGYDCETDRILAEIAKNPLLKGLTLSGGEPFARPAELLPLVKAVRERGMDVICYTGYTFEELMAMSELDPAVEELMRHIDILKDGRFIQEQRDLGLKFRGSRNQRLLDMRKSLAEKSAVGAELG